MNCDFIVEDNYRWHSIERGCKRAAKYEVILEFEAPTKPLTRTVCTSHLKRLQRMERLLGRYTIKSCTLIDTSEDANRNKPKSYMECVEQLMEDVYTGKIDPSDHTLPLEIVDDEDKPSESTFTLSDIQRVIERIENEMAECGYTLTEHGLRKAIEIMREELKLGNQKFTNQKPKSK